MLALLLALSVAATDPTATELLTRGERLLADLEYDDAAATLMRAAAAPDATDAQRMQAHLLAGIASRVSGRDADARLNFRNVLLAAPETRLPAGTSPKVHSFFEAVRQEVAAERASTPQRAPASAPPPPTTQPTPSAQPGAKDARPPPPDPRARAGVWPWVVAGAGAAAAAGSVGLATVTFYDASAKVSRVQGALDVYSDEPNTNNRRALVDAANGAENAALTHNCAMLPLACFCVPLGTAALLGGAGWAVYDGVAE